MNSDDCFYIYFEIKDLTEIINILPELHKCRIIGFLQIQQNSYIVKSFSDSSPHHINIIFDELSKIPNVSAPEPVQIFGEVVHFLNDGGHESALRVVIIHHIQPTLLNPLYNVIKEIKDMEYEEKYGLQINQSVFEPN